MIITLVNLQSQAATKLAGQSLLAQVLKLHQLPATYRSFSIQIHTLQIKSHYKNPITSNPSSPLFPPNIHTFPKMASSQEIRRRAKEEDQVQEEQDMETKNKRTGTARRGLRSLSIALAIPLSLTLLDIYLFGSTRKIEKPFYFPPLWALHLACLGTVFLSGLSAWLIWAEGGFHRQPNALILYLGQLMIGLVWYPVVFRAGAFRVGLVLCAALFGVLIGCSCIFKKLNPIAGDLMKGSLVWAALVAAVNVRLVYH